MKCEKDIAVINSSIRACVERKSKIHAKILLRKRKIVEHDIKNTCEQILTLQKRISTLENLKLTKMQIDGVSSATRALSKFVSKNNIDRIEKLQDDMIDLTDQLCDMNQCFMVDDVDVDDVVVTVTVDNVRGFIACTGSGVDKSTTSLLHNLKHRQTGS